MNSLAYAALWVFVFGLPWERVLQVPGVSSLAKVTGAAALGLALVAVAVSCRFRRVHVFHVLAVLFWVWAGVVLLVVQGGAGLPRKFWTFAQLLVVLWMIWELAPSERRQRGLMTAYILGGYVAAIDTILLYREAAGVVRRFAAGGADPNELAAMLALGIPMAWYLGMTYQGTLLRWTCRAYLPLVVVAIGLTGSRGGMVTTTMALMIVPALMTRLSPRRLLTSIAMVSLAGVLAVAYTPETLIERLSTTGRELEGGRIGGRGKYWRAGWRAFMEQPIVGYGTGGFRGAIAPMMGTTEINVAHNSFISVAVEQGIVGLLLYVGMLAAVCHSALKLSGLERRFALVLFGTLGVAMMPLTWEDARAVWFTMAALLGFSQALLAKRGAARPPVPRRPPLPDVRERGRRRDPRTVTASGEVGDASA